MAIQHVLVIDCQNPLANSDFLRGVAATARRRPGMAVTLSYTNWTDDLTFWLRSRGSLSGVILPLRTRQRLAHVQATGAPFVDAWGTLPGSPCPGVTHDEREIGRMVARHLMGQGYRHFAFVGTGDAWSIGRYQGFAATLGERGFECAATVHKGEWWSWGQVLTPTRFSTWLRDLPKPVGIMVHVDQTAAEWVAAAVELGYRVPDEVAVVGVDNSRLRCDLAAVPMSSIDPDDEALGRIAMRMLLRLMDGQPVPHEVQRVPPRGIVVRASSEYVAHGDPELNRVVKLLNRQATRVESVQQLAQDAAVSRRTLDRKFRATFGTTPHEHLVRRRIVKACTMLAETDQKVSQIAAACGFRQASHFNAVFRKAVGQSPTQYRKERAGG